MSRDQGELIDRLREVHRDREELEDSRWERLCQGAVSDEERRSLEGESSEMYEVFRPFDEKLVERAIERVFEKTNPRPKRSWTAPVLAAATAAFATAGLVIAPLLTRAAPIPYALELPAIDAPTGFELVLRPKAQVTENLRARCALAPSTDHARAVVWSPPMIEKPDGTFIVSGTGAELFADFAPGFWDLRCAVGEFDESLSATELFALEQIEGGVVVGADRPIEIFAVTTPAPLRVLAANDRWAVEFSGCESVRTSGTNDPLCIVGQHPLRLWAPEIGNSKLSLEVDGADRGVEGVPVEGGLRIDVELPSAPGKIKLIARSENAIRAFELAIAPEKPSPSLELAEQLRQEGKLDEARTRLLELTSERAPPDIRARATGKLARIAKRRGHAGEAVELFEQAIELDRAAGLTSDAVFDSFVLSLVHITRQNFAAARAAFARSEPWEQTFPQGKVMGLFYRGVLHAELGELWEALASYEQSRAGSRRLSLVDHEIDVLQQEADILARLGRTEDALHAIAEAERLLNSRPWKPCTTAQVLTNRGETHLRTGQAGEAIEPLAEALQLYTDACPDPTARINVDIDLALATLSVHRHSETQSHVGAARREPSPTPRQETWLEYLEGRIALQNRDPKRALGIFERLSEELPETDAQAVHAATGRALALDQLGHVDEARTAYRRADALIDRWSLQAPLAAADLLLEGTSARIEFLVRIGALQEAAETARAANSRSLRAFSHLGALEQLEGKERAVWEAELVEYRRQRSKWLDERRDVRRLRGAERTRAVEESRRRIAEVEGRFELALARRAKRTTQPELRAPRRGEALLIFHSLADGWIGFAVSGTKISASRFDGAPTLAPFRELLAGVENIRVSMPGSAALSSPVPMIFGLDLGEASKPSAEGAASIAVLVGDPTGSDASARLELEQLKEILTQRGLRVELLTGAEATRIEVERRLAQPDLALFHYVGARDRFGLGLAHDEYLGVSDILALDQVPPIVVLSGSTPIAAGVRGSSSALSAPQAFALAGVRSVVAYAWDGDEEASSGMMSSFYRALDTISPPAIAGAMRKISAGSSFRVFEP